MSDIKIKSISIEFLSVDSDKQYAFCHYNSFQ